MDTLLWWVVDKGHAADVVQVLVRRGGVGIDTKDSGGQIPLSWCKIAGRPLYTSCTVNSELPSTLSGFCRIFDSRQASPNAYPQLFPYGHDSFYESPSVMTIYSIPISIA